MLDRTKERWQARSDFILTEGGLLRTLKVGHPEHTMHLRWKGAVLARDAKLRLADEPDGASGEAGPPGEARALADTGTSAEADAFLIEIELIRIEGDQATIRIWAPRQVEIGSAKKDPHRRTA